jgi:hypothetical protein
VDEAEETTRHRARDRPARNTKPVDPLLGQAINAWEALRPSQPKRTDRRTGEQVDFLFSYRARAVSSGYINSSIIPMLCRKAGIPATDIRGSITSHRARSTIASQLYNAKEPMTLFELQAWLGHRSPQSTQHYAKITPNALSKAYSEAGYFERNVRTIEVLVDRVDRDAVASGTAAAGEPWQHFDLEHGYCTYTFFEQCQHRTPQIHESPTPRSQRELAEDGRLNPTHRGRTSRGHRRSDRDRLTDRFRMRMAKRVLSCSASFVRSLHAC